MNYCCNTLSGKHKVYFCIFYVVNIINSVLFWYVATAEKVVIDDL